LFIVVLVFLLEINNVIEMLPIIKRKNDNGKHGVSKKLNIIKLSLINYMYMIKSVNSDKLSKQTSFKKTYGPLQV
jgi:hypothetical protein